MMFRAAAAIIATSIYFSPSVVRAANYSLGTPFRMSCVGTLEYKAGAYFLSVDDDHPNSSDDDNRICGGATIAEEKNKYALRYTLREKTIIRLLRTCSLGDLCQIVGYMNGLSHDIWFWVKIDAISKLDDPSKRAAEADCTKLYSNKKYLPAEECWQRKARAGDLDSQFQLGKFYYQGIEGKADKKQAASWFTAAAEKGHAGSQTYLAFMYLMGEGVPKSSEKAIELFETAAKRGDLSAAENLAFHFKDGQIVSRDLGRALYWCRYYIDRQKKDELPAYLKDGCEKWLGQ